MVLHIFDVFPKEKLPYLTCTFFSRVAPWSELCPLHNSGSVEIAIGSTKIAWNCEGFKKTKPMSLAQAKLEVPLLGKH